MIPFFKDPSYNVWEEKVIQYITSVTYYSVKKITVPSCNYIRYQNDLNSVAESIGSTKKSVNLI